MKYRYNEKLCLVGFMANVGRTLLFQNLADANAKLEEEIERLEKEMENGRHEIDKTTDEYFKFKVNCIHSFTLNQTKLKAW